MCFLVGVGSLLAERKGKSKVVLDTLEVSHIIKDEEFIHMGR